MGLYEVVVEQRYLEQECISRFNYLSTGTPAAVTGSLALCDALGFLASAGNYPSPSFFEDMRGVQTVAVNYVQVVVLNVYDPTDFYATPFEPNTNGLNTGAGYQPTFMAYGFRTNQTRRDIRRGQKRLVGVNEQYIGDGGGLLPQQQLANDQFAVSMTATQSYNDEGNTLTFAPVVVSKQKYTPVGSTSEAYRYYPTLAEQLNHLAQSITWTAENIVTTQNSRKRGRGS